MKIGINASYLSKDQKTGIENFSSRLIFHLLNQDKQNQYLLFSPKQIDKADLPPTKNYKLIISPFPKFWHRFRLPLAIIRNKIDIFFDPGYTVPPFIAVKSIVVVHDLAIKYYPEGYNSRMLALTNTALRRAQSRASGIVFVSNNTKKDFNKFYPNSTAKQRVIYQGINCEKFGKSRANRDPLHLETKYIIYTGRLETRKNIVRLVQSYALLRHQHKNINHKLVLAGKHGIGYELIKNEIFNNRKYGQDIIELGFVSDNDLPHIYRNADLLVLPSLYEGFGIPILEAFASDIPVVCSKSSSLPEVAGSAAVYFDPLDIHSMASIIANVISNNKLRQKMICAGKNQLKKFDFSKTANEFIDFFHQVMGK